MAEVDARFQELPHGNDGHKGIPFWLPAAAILGLAVASWSHSHPRFRAGVK